MFARLSVNLPTLSGEFEYSVPEQLEGQVQAGCLVIVPFGGRNVQGVILEIAPESRIRDPKPILDLLDPAPVLTPPQIALARQLSENTLTPLASIVALMLPPGLAQQADLLYTLKARPAEDSGAIRTRLVNLLGERGPLRGRQIDAHFSRVNWRPSARVLVRKGILEVRNILPPARVRPKFVRVAQLAVPPEAAQAAMEGLGTQRTTSRRQGLLRFLMREPQAVNLSWLYAETGCNLNDLEELEERGLIRLFENEVFRDPLAGPGRDVRDAPAQFELSADQEAALRRICASLSESGPRKPFLLYGVTGSGKTEIYLRAAQAARQLGRRSLLLVPEIALTPQVVRRFQAAFPGEVGLVHSRLSPGERYDTWRRARMGKLQVIIGPRSALFSPLPDIGLIVVDECHDASYHQSDPPFYHAVAAAQAYARLCGAICLLGSATPGVEQRYDADLGRLERLDLPARVADSMVPAVEMVDMRAELKAGNRSIFARPLAESLAETVSRREQAILFLNRRGTATYVFCRDCGAALKCPRCDTPLTLHTDLARAGEALLCHRCGYERRMPERCDSCGSGQIRSYGLGSEQVEREVRSLLPSARVLRWDRDAARTKDAHEFILTHFSNHQADILVGTQMLAKGLDLPRVTLVGIVLADVGLSFPDPFAAERVFQNLTQVAGRAGRSARGGRVILQTFQPDHYAIECASRLDVDGFFQQEREHRRRLGYPPFARLVRLEFRHPDSARAEAEARRVAQFLQADLGVGNFPETELIGPAPCYFARQAGIHRWQVVLRGRDPVSLVRNRRLEGWRIEVDPISLL